MGLMYCNQMEKIMKLVYSKNKCPVCVGDRIVIDEEQYEVKFFSKPHKPAASGKVTVAPAGFNDFEHDREFYVSIIGAEWIEREDQ